MVPLRLRLRNFMCYREEVPVLELEGIPVACLSGENGNGKTALLEAMTWALWGAARGRKDLDDDLIFVGASDMEVELDFAAREQRYRVIRKHSRATLRRPGQTILDLQIEGPDGFRSIAGSTVRETERILRDIVRIDYDTFKSSAFLLQGHDDVFTSDLKPTERKRLLGEMLGLEVYDTLARRARDEGQRRRMEAGQRQREIAEAEDEVKRRPEVEAERQIYEASLADITRSLVAQQRALEEAQRRLAELEVQQAQQAELEARRSDAEHQGQAAETEVTARQARLAAYEAVRARSGAITDGNTRLQAARDRDTALTQALQQHLQLQQRQQAAEQGIEAARHDLDGRRTLLEGWAQELDLKAATQAPLNQELLLIKDKLMEMGRWGANLQALREREEALSEEIVRLQAENESLRKGMDGLRERLDLLHQEGAVCPVCQQPLDDAHRHELQESYQKEGELARDRYRANEGESQAKQRQRDGIRERRSQLERDFALEQETAQRRLGQLETALEEAHRAAASLAQVQEERATIFAMLVAGAYAEEARASLAEVRSALAALAYDPEAHRVASEQAAALAPFEDEARALVDAESRWQEEAASLEKALEAAQRWRAEARQLHERLALLEASLASLPDLRRAVETGLAAVATLQEQRGATEQLLGAAKQRLDNLAALERRLAQSRAALRTLQDEQSLYEDLARAFGPNGVPALLIEQAIPALQDTANELLARMSDSRLSINLIMQRPTQRGGSSETLDIRVADEQGTRKYETYSGGEAFRINFALRVALSKFLAHRAGAPLPTLFLDEGFGSQDTAGREKLIEAIDAIRDDFQRILVITHMEDVKEAFPVRIEVTKTEDGATFVMR